MFHFESVYVSQLCLTLQSHGLQTVRFLCPWNSPGKNTRVACHFFLHIMSLRVMKLGVPFKFVVLPVPLCSIHE